MLCLLVRFAHIFSGLFIQALFLQLIIFSTVNAQEYNIEDYYVNIANNTTDRDGESWETAWQNFDEFDFASDIRANARLHIAPGEYRISSYQFPGDKEAIIYLDGNYDLTIFKDIPPNSVNADVILKGVIQDESDTTDWGAYIIGGSKRICIREIKFEHFKENAIFASNSDTILIQNCTVDTIMAIPLQQNDPNRAAIKIQNVNLLEIDNCILNLPNEDSGAQFDGIYIDNTDHIKIRSNIINLENNYVGIHTPHIDVIQITVFSSDVLIEGNDISFEGIYGLNTDFPQQGVYVLQTTGDIIVRNNNIESITGREIHIYYNDNTNVQVYNNTLIGSGSPYQLMEFTDVDDVSPYQKLNIKNNILFQSGSNSSLVKFRWMGEDDIKQINILNNNLYYVTQTAVPKIYFEPETGSAYTRNWNYNGWWETQGKNADPFFVNVSNDDYRLNYNSPCKNSGVSFTLEKDFYGNKRPYWSDKAFDIGAYELPDAHIKIGRPTSTNYTTNIDAMGPVFERNGTIWEVSSSANLYNLSFTTNDHCANPNKEFWDGINFDWLHQGTSDPNSPSGIGLYKYELYGSPEKYFYLDTRDANYSVTYNPNIYIEYDPEGFYRYFNGNNFVPIDNGDVLRAWDILNHIPSYNSLWPDILAVYPKIYDETGVYEPNLDWRPYSGYTPSEYQIYFQFNGGSFFQYIDAVPNNIYQYQHKGMEIGEEHTGYYYIVAHNPSGTSVQSNTVSIGVDGEYKRQAANSLSNSNMLLQNYPNPFNPITQIRYSVSDPGLVSLKVFDILGREVKTLVNEVKDTGSYEVMFNPTNLSSGIYIYQFRVNNYTSVKKMQYIK